MIAAKAGTATAAVLAGESVTASAVDLMAEHGRRVCRDMAGGNDARLRGLLRQQGEVMFLAGLQLMAEGSQP